MNTKFIAGSIVAAAVLASFSMMVSPPGDAARPAYEPVAAGLQSRDMPRPVLQRREAMATPKEYRDVDADRRPIAAVFPHAAESVEATFDAGAAELTVAPHPDLPMTFQRVATRTDGGYTTWIGRNVAMPGASYVGVSSARGYHAVLLVPGVSQFNFHVQGDEVLVQEIVSRGSDCALWHETLPPVEAASPGTFYWEASDAKGDQGGATSSAATGLLNVDVLFLYNTHALAVARDRAPADPVDYLVGYSRAALETVNLVLENSRVDTFRWRYVGLLAMPEYPPKETVPEDLQMMAPGQPLHAFVQAARAQYGADQVMMWVGPGVRQGAAYIGDDRKSPAVANATLSALRLTGGVLILGHELAHNFGCTHDRAHAGSGDGSTAAPEGDGRWNYGLMWTDPGATSTSGTVMAYANFLVPYFSNPNITLNVTSTMQNRPGPFLELGTHTIGFVESDPRAAYNVRVLNEGAAYMAAISPEASAPPSSPSPPPTAPTVPSPTPNPVTASGGGGGGGGAPSAWFILGLLSLWLARRWR
jgi:hypothetical protein